MSETDQSREYEGPYKEYYYEGMEQDLHLFETHTLERVLPIQEFLLSNAKLSPELRIDRISKLVENEDFVAKINTMAPENLEDELRWQLGGDYVNSLDEITDRKVAGRQYEHFSSRLILASKLPELTSLKIKYGGFFLPPFLNDFPKLDTIIFDNCPNLFLKDDPIKSVDKTMIKNLVFVNNCGLDATTLPSSLPQHIGLFDLFISNYQDSKLPSWFANIKSLRTLRISGQLKFPDEIGQLTNLMVLNFNANAIEQLPTTFQKLTNLVNLNLRRNRLDELPIWLKDLPALQYVDVELNQLSKLPPGLIISDIEIRGLEHNLIPEKELRKITGLHRLTEN